MNSFLQMMFILLVAAMPSWAGERQDGRPELFDALKHCQSEIQCSYPSAVVSHQVLGQLAIGGVWRTPEQEKALTARTEMTHVKIQPVPGGNCIYTEQVGPLGAVPDVKTCRLNTRQRVELADHLLQEDQAKTITIHSPDQCRIALDGREVRDVRSEFVGHGIC